MKRPAQHFTNSRSRTARVHVTAWARLVGVHGPRWNVACGILLQQRHNKMLLQRASNVLQPLNHVSNELTPALESARICSNVSGYDWVARRTGVTAFALLKAQRSVCLFGSDVGRQLHIHPSCLHLAQQPAVNRTMAIYTSNAVGFLNAHVSVADSKKG